MTTISDVRAPYQPALSPISTRAGEWAAIPRVSWPAVFAGAAVVLVVEVMLSVLGVGIGASTISPRPMAGVSIGPGLWFAATTLVSLFLGGWVAGRLAGVFRHMDGALHGIVAWALSSLVAFYLVTTAVGAVVSGAGIVLGGSTEDTLNGGVGVAAEQQRATPTTPDEDAALRAAQERADAMKTQAPRTAREVRAAAAQGVAKASLWTFFVLLIGGIAAALGGRVGAARALFIVRRSDIPIR